MQLQQPQPRIRIHALHPRHIKNSSASGRDTPLSGLALDVYGQVLAVVYEAADRYPADRTSQLVDLTWVYAPPRMCQYPAGVVNPQRHTYQGRTGRGSSGTRAAQVAPLLPGKHPHLRAPLCKVQVEFHCGLQYLDAYTSTMIRVHVSMV